MALVVGLALLTSCAAALAQPASGVSTTVARTVELAEWKDCTVPLGGKQITLKKGQSRTVTLNVSD